MMKKLFFILLVLSISTVHADEVFKCQLKSGKTVYQSTPCKSAVKQKTIEIQKVDPRKVAEEEAKLKAWKEDFAKREAERAQIEKERQAERDRKASVEALQRSAEYQQRQAEALERQNISNPPYQFPSYYPLYQSVPAFPLFQLFPAYSPAAPHHHKERTQQPGQNETKHGKERNDDVDGKKLIFKLR
ncbi:MAG: DUF4124 domain-containing protein [Methylobacter sp.]